MVMKKAFFFTIDSLLASGIVIAAVLLVSSFYIAEQEKSNVNYASSDIVKVFSSMKVGEINNDYVKSLIASGEISNTNNTILEQIGDFWAQEKMELALNFTQSVSEGILPAHYGLSVLVNEDLVYMKNVSSKKTLVASKNIISGIAKSKPTEGFTARVLLSGIKSKRTSSYAYFGGYEGDGNLTKKLVLPKDIISFNNSYLEADVGGNFNLYINNVFSGSYVKGLAGGGNMLADKWNISNAYIANFRPGENIIKINFTSGQGYIAGGFLRVTYTTSSYNDTQTAGYEKYFLPGIDGIINLYSSIYVPGALNNMVVMLNYSSNQSIYLKIGNITVYENKSGASYSNVMISNSTLSGILDYGSISQKTIPIRIGLKDLSLIKGGNVDVILITDVSGSMDWRLDNSNTGISRNCNDPLLYSPSTKRISLAKCLDNQFIDAVLNSSSGNTTNRIGLVAYSGLPNFIPTANSATIVSTHSLSSSNSSLKAQINAYNPNGATGICGSIRQARTLLEQQSNSSRQRFIVVMTDGLANVQCSPASQYSTTGCIPDTCNDNSFCAGGGCLSSQCGDWVSVRASNDSINDACRAYNTTNATVYSIGFGPVASCPISNQTLFGIANCGRGSYFSSGNATGLAEIYNTIAKRILNASFAEQTVNLSGGVLTRLFPSSYIEVNYTSQEPVFNRMPLGFETDRFGNNLSTGTLTIYANTSVLDAKVTSYSGSKWTDSLDVNGAKVFRLSDFGTSYQTLGDPFTVNIPPSAINQGDNLINIRTGINSSTSTNGSSDDRVIYTLLLNAFADYSSYPFNLWHKQFGKSKN